MSKAWVTEPIRIKLIFVIAVGAALFVVARRYIATKRGRHQWDALKLRAPVLGVLIHIAVLGAVPRRVSPGAASLTSLVVIVWTFDGVLLADRGIRIGPDAVCVRQNEREGLTSPPRSNDPVRPSSPSGSSGNSMSVSE